MNTNQQMPTIIDENEQHYIELECQGFVNHKRREKIDEERDLIIFEIASRLQSFHNPRQKLVQDFKFSYYNEHCAKLGCTLTESYEDFEVYKTQLAFLASEVESSAQKNSELSHLSFALTMVYTLLHDNLLDKLGEVIVKNFPQY